MRVNVHIETPVSQSTRARQLLGMFDVPDHPKSERDWTGDLPIESRKWNVGLIVGSSGAGKSTIAREVFGAERICEWHGAAVVDDFRDDISMQQIAEVCQAVGFNTVPAWLRPYDLLSTGEKFRVDLARRMIEAENDHPLMIDEFSSVVDRQVAQIGAHAVQRWVRRHDRQFVAVSCHYDIVAWLRPDWILEPATMTFRWEQLQPRPAIKVTIRPVDYSAWRLFAPFHYLTASLNHAARCFVLFVGEQPASFAGVLHRPHPRVKNMKAISRLVTLPDWQGLGLAFVLGDALGSAYKAREQRFRMFPAHPSLIRSYDRSPSWALTKRPGSFARSPAASSSMQSWRHDRPNAVFEYVGPASESAAVSLLDGTSGLA